MACSRALLLLALLSAEAGPHAHNTSSSPVVQLNPDNVENKNKSGGVWIIEFYAPW